MSDNNLELDLIDALRAWAAGDRASQAALELLVQTGDWLTRPDFADRCVTVITDPDVLGDGVDPVALIEWAEVRLALETGELVGSSSEIAVLQIAASIGAGQPVSLQRALGTMGPATAAAVVDAIIIATGAGNHVLATRSPEIPRRIVD